MANPREVADSARGAAGNLGFSPARKATNLRAGGLRRAPITDDGAEHGVSRLDRYVFLQLLGVFAFFALVLVSVYWVNRAVRLFDQLVGGGQTLLVFLELSALTLPNVIRLVLPVAAFAAAVYVAARLTRESELTVMRAAGVSPLRMLRPVVAFGAVVAVMLLVLMHVLMPAARAQMAERQAEIAENITARFLTAGGFQSPAQGITVFVRDITLDGELRGVFLSDSRAAGSRIDYTARSALLAPGPLGPKLVMLDGMAQIHDLTTNRLVIASFQDMTYDIGSLIGPIGRGRDVREFSTAELLYPPPELIEISGATPAQLRYELANRFAHPLMAVVAALIGFSVVLVGDFSRLGPWRQVAGAVVLLALMQLLDNAMARPALRDPTLAGLAFVSSVAGLAAVGVVLWWLGRRRGQMGRRPLPDVSAA